MAALPAEDHHRVDGDQRDEVEGEREDARVLSAANSVPASAATAAPKANASSFSQLTGMPITSAASGSSRCERQARPVARPFTKRSATNTISEHAERDEVVARSANAPAVLDRDVWPKKSSGSTLRMPVRAAGHVPGPNRNWSPFVASVWKSCRKKSVTIAR